MKTRLSRGGIVAILLSCSIVGVGCSSDAEDSSEAKKTAAGDAAAVPETPPARTPSPAATTGATPSPRPQADTARVGPAHTNADALLLKDFKDRVDAYMKLHDKHEKGAADPKETSDPAKIKATQDALAARIQAARKDARPGDIFTPEIRNLFRRLMYPEMKGPDAKVTKETIKMEEAAPSKAQVLKVNGRYPEAAALPTVPPNLLARIPPLPEELEYRIVNKDLILRDVNANLIVDFIPNAIQ